jgi:hypothetical protein
VLPLRNEREKGGIWPSWEESTYVAVRGLTVTPVMVWLSGQVARRIKGGYLTLAVRRRVHDEHQGI